MHLTNPHPHRVQGAPEFVLQHCSHVLANNGEGAVPLTEATRQAILADMQVVCVRVCSCACVCVSAFCVLCALCACELCVYVCCVCMCVCVYEWWVGGWMGEWVGGGCVRVFLSVPLSCKSHQSQAAKHAILAAMQVRVVSNTTHPAFITHCSA